MVCCDEEDNNDSEVGGDCMNLGGENVLCVHIL